MAIYNDLHISFFAQHRSCSRSVRQRDTGQSGSPPPLIGPLNYINVTTHPQLRAQNSYEPNAF